MKLLETMMLVSEVLNIEAWVKRLKVQLIKQTKLFKFDGGGVVRDRELEIVKVVELIGANEFKDLLIIWEVYESGKHVTRGPDHMGRGSSTSHGEGFSRTFYIGATFHIDKNKLKAAEMLHGFPRKLRVNDKLEADLYGFEVIAYSNLADIYSAINADSIDKIKEKFHVKEADRIPADVDLLNDRLTLPIKIFPKQ